MDNERTFIALKPDAIQRGLVGEIISRFERMGFKLIAMKLLTPSRDLAWGHYVEFVERRIFGALVDFLVSGPVIAMVWEGKDIVASANLMIGDIDPLISTSGTICGDYGVDIIRNTIHVSYSIADAQREIALWFKEDQQLTSKPSQ